MKTWIYFRRKVSVNKTLKAKNVNRGCLWLFLPSRTFFTGKSLSNLFWKIEESTQVWLRWQWCWWQRYICDVMMVTDLRCWWHNHLSWWFFQCIKSVTNILNLSPTHFVSNICHYHRCHHDNFSTVNLLIRSVLHAPNVLPMEFYQEIGQSLCLIDSIGTSFFQVPRTSPSGSK